MDTTHIELSHVCLRADASKILAGGFAPPQQERKLFWCAPALLGQGREDRVSFGMSGRGMLPWVAMKAAQAVGTKKVPQLVALIVRIPRDEMVVRVSSADLITPFGRLNMGTAVEITSPRGGVRVLGTESLPQMLRRPHAEAEELQARALLHQEREAAALSQDLLLEAALMGVVPQLVAAHLGAARVRWVPRMGGFVEAGVKEAFGAAEGVFQQIAHPSPEISEGWSFVRAIHEAAGDKGKVAKIAAEFNARLTR